MEEGPGNKKRTVAPACPRSPSASSGEIVEQQKVTPRELRRNRVITLYRDAGLTPHEIVQKTVYPRRTVYRWIAVYTNSDDYRDLPRSSRPRKMTPEIKDRVVSLTKGQ